MEILPNGNKIIKFYLRALFFGIHTFSTYFYWCSGLKSANVWSIELFGPKSVHTTIHYMLGYDENKISLVYLSGESIAS
jgi:hypothetical protein